MAAAPLESIKLLVCLVLLLASYAVQLQMALKGNDQIVGTYNTVNGPMNGDGDYLVLQRDSTYYIYRQLEGISEEGSYQKMEEIISLDGEEGSGSLVYDKITGRIYDMRQGEGRVFYRISDTPMFINVDVAQR